jgi:ribonucleoside-diphosphate reductase alpha chain
MTSRTSLPAQPGPQGAASPILLSPESPGFEAVLRALEAERLAADLARAATAILPARLQAVMDAVRRCEGDAEACADLARNASLARAAEAARTAGASDNLIRDAIALARAGEDDWPAPAPAPEATDVAVIAAISPKALEGETGRRLARAVWTTGQVCVAPAKLGEAAGSLLAAPKAVVTLSDCWTGAGFDRFALANSLEAAAYDLPGPGYVGLAGLGGWLTSQGLDYGRKAARGLFDDAAAILKAASRKAGLAVFPEADARAWNGPARAGALKPDALRGLGAAGADFNEARRLVLGTQRLTDAPGLETLRSLGFTDHELAAAERALPGCASLAAAFRPEVIGEGFVRDVLGASEEQVAAPDLDVLAFAGLERARVEAAEAHVLGGGRLSEAEFLSFEARRAFRTADEIGEAA